VESVAWVAERKDVLSGLFSLLTVLAYARYVRSPEWKRYLLVAGIFAFALMSKPSAVVLPNGFQHGYLRTRPDDCAGEDDNSSRCQPAFRALNVPGAAEPAGIVFELGTGLGTAAIGINNRQDIVGLYATPGLYSLGFLLSDGHYRPIDNPASSHTPGGGSKLFNINNRGVMVGDYLAQIPNAPPGAFLTHGFVLDDGKFTPVFVSGSDLGGFGTQANGINDQNVVVGTFTDSSATPQLHALVWVDGRSYTLDYPGMTFNNEAHSINNRGDITGAYATIDGTIHGFVAHPKDR
jgi:hypothetical protein